MTSDAGLSQPQIEVAQVFFSLGASGGYLVSGGAGLIASDLISRPTQDLDLFAHEPTRDVAHARLADDEIPVPTPAVAELRDFFTAWSAELRQSG